MRITGNALSDNRKGVYRGAEHRTRAGNLNLGKVGLYSLKVDELHELVMRVLDELLKDR